MTTAWFDPGMAPPPQVIIGDGIRVARKERGWPQTRLASVSGVPQSGISAIERAAHMKPSLETVVKLCAALGADLVIEVRAAPVIGRLDQTDPGHVACVSAVRRMLERAGWATVTEVEIASGRAHGFIDLLAFHRATGRLLVVEVKTEIRDVGALERQVGWYMREARSAAARLGWRVRSIAGLVVGLATVAVDATVVANRDQFAASFPVRGRVVRATFRSGAEMTGRGIILVDPARRGLAGLVGLAVDGRRGPAPYRDYASFMRTRATRSGHEPRPRDPGSPRDANSSNRAGRNPTP
jgi:transcriptional regulator with XRE-family HTH domain